MYQKPTAFSMAMQINKYLSLGLSPDVLLRACTCSAAKMYGLFPRIGKLEVGANADIAIFHNEDIPAVFSDRPSCDKTKKSLTGKITLKPVLTIKNGMFVYRDITF
jgi:dihydroorotase